MSQDDKLRTLSRFPLAFSLSAYGIRQVIHGGRYTVELHEDGTGRVRVAPTGVPVAITTAQARQIERAIAALVDQLAEVAIRTPAPWPADEVAMALPAGD